MTESPEHSDDTGIPAVDLDITNADTWPEFLTVDEVAAVLRVSPLTVRKRISDGYMPPPTALIGKTQQRWSKQTLLRAAAGLRTPRPQPAANPPDPTDSDH